MISFLLNQQQIDITQIDPDTTVLNYLREQCHLTGTKEGCASGDCGACTVVVAEPSDNGKEPLAYRAINSCVTSMGALHGKQLLTVEHLADGQTLHPIQQAMVDHHASQCGFCTPGFVMSAFALYHQHSNNTNRDAVIDALSGNLCRCTGYRPIIDATLQACQQRQPDKFTQQAEHTRQALLNMQNQPGNVPGLYRPTTRSELAALKAAFPDATLVAGSTDLALTVTQQLGTLGDVIYLPSVVELQRLQQTEDRLIIGSAVPLSTLHPWLVERIPALAELFQRFASLPIRNQATLGGNIANASPIGDLPPVVLALEGIVVLDDGTEQRRVPASDFFQGYRKTALLPTEWIDSIEIPLPSANTVIGAYKISKRHEDDISAICAVFALTIEDDVIRQISSGFGGVAATPVQAKTLAASLQGKSWTDKQTCEEGMQLLRVAFSPIDDVRGSADYRKESLARVWKRFWLSHTPGNETLPVRVIEHA